MDKETQTIFYFTSELKKNYIGEPVPAVPLPTQQEPKEISSKFNCNLSIEEISLLRSFELPDDINEFYTLTSYIKS